MIKSKIEIEKIDNYLRAMQLQIVTKYRFIIPSCESTNKRRNIHRCSQRKKKTVQNDA